MYLKRGWQVKLQIDNVEIECTPIEAVEFLQQLKAHKSFVPYEGQPTWKRVYPPDSTPPYVITVSGTLDRDKIAERCKTVWRTV